jgi:hypothetical protein
MVSLPQRASNVQTREQLIDFIRDLRDDYETNNTAWDNPTVDRYLDALVRLLVRIDAFYQSGETIPDQPSWQLIAELLLSASSYE